MNRKRNLRPAAVLAAIAALLMIMPGSAAAATPISFNLSIGFFCAQGSATAGAPVAVTWKAADGTLKARTTVTAESDGSWELCNEPAETPVVAIGDTVKANDGHSTRTFTVPRLTV